ncbi:MAG: hypothetical protein IJZ82_04090 [Lachnospiraceae bacterium]|nr:hypothetical protein [Lachnospiraceae bacterium]
MLDKLIEGYEVLADGEYEALKDVVDGLKALPRTAEGVFDFASQGIDVWEAARYAYPVYCAYETQCNKKEGYPDLVKQLRSWDKIVASDFTVEVSAEYMDMLISTIEVMSPEIYEYYREVVEIYRAVTKKVIEAFYAEGGFGEAGSVADEMLQNAIARGCEIDVLLSEKYMKYVNVQEEE